MDTQPLVAIGLTPLQAAAYAELIEYGTVKPPELAIKLNTTRTNAYKLLDKLVELKLAARTESGKKNAYTITSPMALTSLTAQYRAEAVAREEAVSNMMLDLLAKYHVHSDRPDVVVATGRKDVLQAYRTQLALCEDVSFIRTKADILAIGYDAMHDIRITPARHSKRRRAIMTAHSEQAGPINYASHKRSNLEITWAKDSDYDAPVEWSVTDSSLLIVLYASEPHAILITDSIVAGAFLQIFRLLSSLLQSQPLHQALKPST